MYTPQTTGHALKYHSFYVMKFQVSISRDYVSYKIDQPFKMTERPICQLVFITIYTKSPKEMG